MNLIYMCVFYQESYINLLKLLLTSIKENSNINNQTTEILILTTKEFSEIIESTVGNFTLPIKYFILDFKTLFEAGCARLHLFEYEHITKYDKILYLDTDILINNDINTIFNISIDDNKLYTLEEGHLEGEWWGSHFFDFTKYNKRQTAFTSGILFFKNSTHIQELFKDILIHIDTWVNKEKKPINACLDQPFIVYNAIVQGKYDNEIMKKYAENSPKQVKNQMIIYHFPGGPGDFSSKFERMTAFWKKMKLKKELTKIY